MPAESSARQRLHPGMLSIQDRATAHYGAVWDLESGYNTLVNFEMVHLQTSKAVQLAISQETAQVFVPCMTVVKAFDIWSGKMSLAFRGHYESVNCCWFSSQDQELYTGGNDRQILVWSPCKPITDDTGILKIKIIGVIRIYCYIELFYITYHL
ncbi:DNA excision repair protein ERCC-8-like isoform X3 [Hibiscus syriacus]|uniref:DNA excision repair protein ERCC-8-like isoform X3 n=1 Tax=Hibiscus syriacus TaxID=106335 RepID=A0A6A2WEX7_HIBSY|nr:DNA excision repair protein ERCC-8-like isoform X3 [Hibiscus syriacus]